MWKNHFHEKIKIFQKRTLFDEILLPAFISSLQTFELNLPDPLTLRILHIRCTYFLCFFFCCSRKTMEIFEQFALPCNFFISFISFFRFVSLFIIVFDFDFTEYGLRSNKIWTWSRKIFNDFPMIQVLNLIQLPNERQNIRLKCILLQISRYFWLVRLVFYECEVRLKFRTFINEM